MEPVYEVALVTAAAVVAAALFYFVCRKIFLLKFLSRRGSWTGIDEDAESSENLNSEESDPGEKKGFCPLPSNLRKHVYTPPEGNEDKLTLEKALEISKARESEVLPVNQNLVFQDPGKWCKWNTKNGPRIVSHQKVLTFHCYKPDFAWVGRDIGKTFACFKCDEFGLLDKDLTLESANGDLLYILNKSEKKAKKVQLPAPIDNRGNRWPDEIPPP